MTCVNTEFELLESPRRQIARRIFKTDNITSTNQVLLSDPDKIFRSGDVLWSLEQSEGRGRYDRTWESGKGGLYFSILFEDIPGLTAFYPFVLLFALAIRKTMADKTHEDYFTLKWPNDIYADDHKIAGILVQSLTFKNKSRAVIGAGINVNNAMLTTPNLRTPAVSLMELTGNYTDLSPLLQDILDYSDTLYKEFIHNRFSNYLPEMNRVLYSKDKPFILTEGKKQRIIIPRELTSGGHLLCEEDGETVILMI